MNRINRLFEYLEDLILSIIAIMTLGAVGFELPQFTKEVPLSLLICF
tara:strand:- start:1327 stop:1467 length:141 start_codon:yes stop_codon:yes gene_type:complete